MTLNELILELERFANSQATRDIPVVVPGYERGVDDLETIIFTGIRRDVNNVDSWWTGRHERVRHEGDEGEPAILLVGRHNFS